ncbi:MAG TPA: class I SAM-dependent methyltransferase [Burkholderiaceae bacterium]|jgi:SAM-dependent methyltransferase|nr:class I SAM-dependent methyltransferase [Burkholderiaceae bacterium]
MSPQLKRSLLSLATEPYRLTGGFNYRWALGKLRYDPMFVALLDQGVIPDGAQVLDLGCGRGLLAAWFLAAEQLAARGQWSGVVAPPQGLYFRGVEQLAREAECGHRALQAVYGNRLEISTGDLREANLRNADVIVMLDVLHYLSYAEQDRLLDRVRAALGAGGLFVTRVGNAGATLRFKLGHFSDRLAAFIQGQRRQQVWCRPAAAWIAALKSRGFAVKAQPMSRGTPFANVMLIAQVG